MKFPRLLFLVFLITNFLSAAVQKQYFCPMKCEGEKVYAKPGTCPVCGMNLELKTATKPTVSSLDFRVDVKSTPEKLVSGKPAELRISIRNTKDNSIHKEFETVHEKKMHFIVVSQELDFFAHLHPDIQPDGSFVVKGSFPRGGNFIGYVDVTPRGRIQQIFPVALQVEGPRPAATPVLSKKSLTTMRKIGEYQTRFRVETPPVVGLPVTLKVSIKYRGQDVKDLQPYLGAPAHMVIIHEDTTQFLHVHPRGHDTLTHAHEHGAEESMGPEVQFISSFPKSGTYKAWIQFQHKGVVQTADYIIHVKD